MMPSACRLLAAMVVLAAQAGCNKGEEERAQAAGEILEGTASDAMLRTDLIRSEAPLAPRATGTGNKLKASQAGPVKAGEAPPDAAPTGEAPAEVEPSPPVAPASTTGPAT